MVCEVTKKLLYEYERTNLSAFAFMLQILQEGAWNNAIVNYKGIVREFNFGSGDIYSSWCESFQLYCTSSLNV